MSTLSRSYRSDTYLLSATTDPVSGIHFVRLTEDVSAQMSSILSTGTYVSRYDALNRYSEMLDNLISVERSRVLRDRSKLVSHA